MIYDLSYKTLIGAKPIHMFYKVDGVMTGYDGEKYLELFGLAKHDAIFDRIRYIIGLKSRLTYVFSYKYAKIKFKSDDGLPVEETLTLHNVLLLIKSLFYNDQNHCCYDKFLKRCSYQLAKK